MKTKTLFMLLISTLLLGCNVMEYEVFRSYINTYYSHDEIDVDLTDAGNIRVYGSAFNQHFTWKSKESSKEVYDMLSKRNNDLSYNTQMGYIVGTHWGHAYAEDIASINVQSNSDFDEQHPAGISLNDVITLVSVSPKKFIDSSYQQTYNWDTNLSESFKSESKSQNFGNGEFSLHYHPIEKKLSEITSSDMVLAGFDIYCYAFLLFDSAPTASKEHKLTITIRTGDGKVYSPTITKVFD